VDNPLKILYVHRSAGRTYGGALVELLRVLERLDRGAFEPRVLLSLEDFHADLFRKIGVRTICLPLPSFRKGKSLPKIPFVLYRLVRFLRREGIDLVHVNDADDAALLILASKWVGIPCLVHARSEMEPKKFKKLRVHRADRVLAVSEAVRQAAISGGVEEKRVRTSYSGCDLEKIEKEAALFSVRERFGLPSDALLVGSVANIAPKKGLHYLIEACARVSDPSLFCVIVGADDHGMQKDLVARADALGIGHRVRFVGFQERVIPFIAAMDLFVLASVDEGFGIVLLEAMALGKPVIATEVHGPPEIVLSGKTGFLVPPADSDALAKAITLLARNADLREEMGRAGRARVWERFTLERQVREWESIYRSLHQERGR